MIRRMGRPGLVGTMARTAVVAGTATAVSGGVIRHQQNKQAEQAEAQAAEQQAAAPPPPPPAAAPEPAPASALPLGDETVAQLEQLADLKAKGILSEEEFAAAKAKLLGI
jgi:Short C-terminal domain